MCYVAAIRVKVRRVLAEQDELHRKAFAMRVHPAQIDVHNIYNSPLHDARRTFLASLVLASKFQLDRAYSNKAWAKLSGLPAQEVTMRNCIGKRARVAIMGRARCPGGSNRASRATSRHSDTYPRCERCGTREQWSLPQSYLQRLRGYVGS